MLEKKFFFLLIDYNSCLLYKYLNLLLKKKIE